MKAGELAQLSVDSLTLDGEGAGRLAQREVRCRGVFPGEIASVRIAAVSRQHARAHADLLRLERPHSDRRVAPCPNHEARIGRCAGCAIMELDEAAQREAKRIMLRERFGLAVERVQAAAQPLGYRYSSKRVAAPHEGRLTLGSFAHGSHVLAPMPGCLVDHPQLVAAFAAVERTARELAIEPYDERGATGDLRYVWAKTNGRDVILTLVTRDRASRVDELAARLADAVAGILHSVQPDRGNTLRGQPAELLHGRREVALTLLGSAVEVGALGFLQPNPQVAEAAYAALTRIDDVAGRGLAFDLYAGAGVTTRVLAQSFAEVSACEAQPESAAALGVAAQRVEEFLEGELSRADRRRPDLLVANPPRKGLGVEVCGALRALGAPHVHIMSCGPEALARDLATLTDTYETTSLEAFDTLPQTPHVELVARLRRRT